MKTDIFIGKTLSPMYAKKTQKPFVYIKKALKKRSSKDNFPHETEKRSQVKTTLNVVA